LRGPIEQKARSGKTVIVTVIGHIINLSCMGAVKHDLSFEELRKAVAPIAERYGVGKMILFGSMARGDYREGSDYDFCVDLGKIDDLVKMCGFIMELESLLGVPVDVVSERTMDEDMSKEVFEDGRVIYESA